jgi:hypothetical protein
MKRGLIPTQQHHNFKADDSQISNLKQINYPSSFRISTLSYVANVYLIQVKIIIQFKIIVIEFLFNENFKSYIKFEMTQIRLLITLLFM